MACQAERFYEGVSPSSATYLLPTEIVFPLAPFYNMVGICITLLRLTPLGCQKWKVPRKLHGPIGEGDAEASMQLTARAHLRDISPSRVSFVVA